MTPRTTNTRARTANSQHWPLRRRSKQLRIGLFASAALVIVVANDDEATAVSAEKAMMCPGRSLTLSRRSSRRRWRPSGPRGEPRGLHRGAASRFPFPSESRYCSNFLSACIGCASRLCSFCFEPRQRSIHACAAGRYRSPCTAIFETSTPISARSSAVSCKEAPPRFSSRR